MTDDKSPTRLVGYAPAKLNLFFEIHGKRSDGYHDVCSLCCPVNLYDTLIFELQKSPDVTLTCETGHLRNDSSEIPTGADNLVVQAVQLIQNRYDISSGCKIRLIKRIPSQAGMGGASSDAATAIRLASQLWNLQLTPRTMMELGAELGSDVPLFFISGMSIGYGRGEQVKPVGLTPRLDFVIVKPPEGISTAAVFRVCCADHITDRRFPECLLQGLQSGNLREITAGIFNRLETTTQKLCPRIGQMSRLFDTLGCSVRQMTGSGTAYFALCHHATQARFLAAQLRIFGIGDVFVAHSVTLAN